MNYYMAHQENQYIQLIRDILDKGSEEISRNGKVLSLFGYSMRFSLKNGVMPQIGRAHV